jgi:hypothetical protein
MRKMRNACSILVGKPEGKRRRWEDNINIDLSERRCENVD